jgi:hypothetical protein
MTDRDWDAVFQPMGRPPVHESVVEPALWAVLAEARQAFRSW